MTKADEMRNAVVLAFVFVVLIFANFGAIALISLEYETDGISQLSELWVSDTDTVFPVYDYKIGSGYQPYWYNLQNQYRLNHGGDFFEYNKSATYLGNDTYSFAVNGTTIDPSSGGLITLMAIPNLNRWVIKNVTVSLFLNGDSDLNVKAIMLHFNNDIDRDNLAIVETVFHVDSSAGGSTWYNKSLTVSLAEALRIYDLAQETVNYALLISVSDKDLDGYSDHSYKFKVTVYGQQISGWSITDSLMVAVGGFAILNTIVIVFMFDKYDLMGYKKSTIGQKSTPKKKKSKSKRKNR